MGRSGTLYPVSVIATAVSTLEKELVRRPLIGMIRKDLFTTSQED